jgi:endonuclease YncB( thermonuclease family)
MAAIPGLNLSQLQQFPIGEYDVLPLDGDTILLTKGGKRVVVRLAGIDSPEKPHPGRPGQMGSAGAIAYLQRIINDNRGRLALYIVPGESTHNRLVGFLVAGGRNINLELVQHGHATVYSPAGGIQGAQMGMFRAAQREAVKGQTGIFALQHYRDVVELNRVNGQMAHVSMVDPELQGTSIRARVRLRTLKGMAGGDHRRSTYGGFEALNPNRPDFIGSNTTGNPESMKIIEEQLRRVESVWKGLNLQSTDYIGSFDIETTGLGAADFTTFAGGVDFTDAGPRSYEYFVTPSHFRTADDSWKNAHIGGVDSKYHEAAIRSAGYPGGHMVPGTPKGRIVGREYVEAQLRASGMSNDMIRNQLASLDTKEISPQGAMQELFSSMRGKRKGWLFIQNANFESMRMAAAIDEQEWAKMVTGGGDVLFAAGRPGARRLHTKFDTSLANLRQRSFDAANKLDFDSMHLFNASWFERLSDMIRGRIQAPEGIKVVDVMDVSRGVFGLAHKRGLFKGNVRGLLGQDLMAHLMGMSAEVHMSRADSIQALEITGRLLGIGEKLRTGEQLAPSEAAIFSKAQELQPNMELYDLYRDVANKLRGRQIKGSPADELVNIRNYGAIKPPSEAAAKELHIGGKLATPAQANALLSYAEYEDAPGTMSQYVNRELQRIGATGVDADRLITTASAQLEAIQQVSPREFASHTMHPDFQATIALESTRNPLTARQAAVEDVFRLHGVEKLMAGPDVVPPKPDTVFDSMKQAFKEIPKEVSVWWKSLEPRTRHGVKLVGAAMAAIGVLGMVRSFFEKKREAQPVSIDIEDYLAQQQTQNVMDSRDDKRRVDSLSSSVASFRMSPNRYPTKV